MRLSFPIRKKRTFSHGVHPFDAKEYSKDVSLERIKNLSEVEVSLVQGFGGASVCIKEIGSTVKKGEKIADPSGAMGNYIYSPINGTIKEFSSVVLPNGIKAPSVIIVSDDKSEESDYVKLPSTSSSLETIKLAGIVGLGGAGFPTNIKYSIKDGKSVDYFIINSAECEPYLTSDYRIGLEKTKECLKGIEECAKILNAKEVFIALESNKKDLYQKFLNIVSENAEFNFIKPILLKTKYPQGDEKNLIKTITNREVPSGKLPLDCGCVVSNLGTVYAIYEAIYLSKPLYERVVTISGDGINTPKNVIAPLGARVKDLVEFAGGFKDGKAPKKCISGGPMMGFAFYDMNTPITKTTSGLTFLNDIDEEKTTPCISCGRCVSACPMNLIPTKMFKLISKGKYKEAMDENLLDCRECGCCEFSCPSHIKLVQGFKLGKKLGREQK